MDYHEAGKIIVNLKNADLKVRNRLIESGELNQGYNIEMQELHRKNAQVLDKIIDKIGYPTIDKVGNEASEAAWLVIQHSIGNPTFMKKSLALLEQAVNEDRADPKNLAYLSDRIAVFEGKHQLYGTQFDWNEMGELAPNAFDEIEKVNKRRKEIGLNSLEEQILIMQDRARNENQCPPPDYKEAKEKLNEWKKMAGWIR